MPSFASVLLNRKSALRVFRSPVHNNTITQLFQCAKNSPALLPGNALRTHSPASRCDGTNHAKWSHGWLPSIALSTCCNDEVVVLIILDVGVQIPLLSEL